MKMLPTSWLLVVALASTPALGATERDPDDTFQRGQVRGGINWDDVSAMQGGVLRFGGEVGVFLWNGFEVGYEQQFIVAPGSGTEARSWIYARLVPFRAWPVNPFVAVRTGFYALSDAEAGALGMGGGLVFFLDRHYAFELSLFGQGVFLPSGQVERQTDLSTRLVVYF
jgi:hypothetical protein